jgi:transposase
MEESIRGLLGIQGWIVYGVREEADRVLVRVGRPRKRARCERCREVSLRVHQRMKWRRVWHMGIEGKGVYLEIRPRRYWCARCQRAFSESYEQIGKWSRRGRVGEALLKRELSEQSFGAVERKTGFGYRALREDCGTGRGRSEMGGDP